MVLPTPLKTSVDIVGRLAEGQPGCAEGPVRRVSRRGRIPLGVRPRRLFFCSRRHGTAAGTKGEPQWTREFAKVTNTANLRLDAEKAVKERDASVKPLLGQQQDVPESRGTRPSTSQSVSNATKRNGGGTPMGDIRSTMAQQIAEAASAFEQRRADTHTPQVACPYGPKGPSARESPERPALSKSGEQSTGANGWPCS